MIAVALSGAILAIMGIAGTTVLTLIVLGLDITSVWQWVRGTSQSTYETPDDKRGVAPPSSLNMWLDTSNSRLTLTGIVVLAVGMLFGVAALVVVESSVGNNVVALIVLGCAGGIAAILITNVLRRPGMLHRIEQKMFYSDALGAQKK